MKLLAWLTGRTSFRADDPATGNVVRFSRVGAVVPLRPNGLPSPNSAAAELVRAFLEPRVSGGGNLKSIAMELGREPRRIYNEAEGESILSWDIVDRAGAHLTLEDRLILGRFLMDRWGLAVTVGPIPRLEA